MSGRSVVIVVLLMVAVVAQIAIADVQLKEVVVTATRTEKSPQDVTQAVTVITKDEIKNSGATSVADVIKTTAGAIVNEQGPNGGIATLRLRGSSYQQVLILLDGKRLNSMRDGGYDLSELPVPLDTIERVEIVRGPASALYGSDAVGGVVNIITKTPSGPSTMLRGAAGAHGYTDLGLRNTGRDGNVYYAINADKVRSVGYRENGDLDKKGAGIKVGYAFDMTSSIELTGDYLLKDIGVPGQITWPSPNARQQTKDLTVGLGFKTKLSKELDLKINAIEKRDTLNYKDTDVFLDSTHKTISRGADMQVSWLMNSWNLLTVGAEARKDQLNSTDSGDHSATLEAAYVQDEINMGESVIVVVGGRNDKHSLYGQKWSPRASVRYLNAGSGTILRASYGESFRAPTFNDLFWPYRKSTYYGIDFIEQGNPALVPETSEEYEAGIEQPFGKGNAVKVTGFRRKVKNLIQWAESLPNPTTFQYNPVNIGRASINGYEAELKYRVSEMVRWTINYTRLFPVNELTGERIFSDAAPMPDMQIGSNLNVALDADTAFSFDYRRVKNYVQPDAGKWDYYTVDGKFTKSFPGPKGLKSDLFVGMKNMFNRTYETAKGYPMPSQEVYGGVALQF